MVQEVMGTMIMAQARAWQVNPRTLQPGGRHVIADGFVPRTREVTLQAVTSWNNRNTVDAIGWAQRVNSRWIAHHGLSEHAHAYLDHLNQYDPDRLARSCRRARRLVRQCEPGEDPKPWFYAALFSLAEESEVRRFLAAHWFTRATNPSRPADEGYLADRIGGETREKLDRIRQALRNLDDESGSAESE